MIDFLEAAMLTAFSVSWYCSIWKMLTTGRASGKSLGFVLLICAGYVCGIASKVVLFAETGAVSGLVLLYAWNLLVTGFDAFLVYHYGRRDQGAPQHALIPRLEEAATRTFARNASPGEAEARSSPARAAVVK